MEMPAAGCLRPAGEREDDIQTEYQVEHDIDIQDRSVENALIRCIAQKSGQWRVSDSEIAGLKRSRCPTWTMRPSARLT